MQIRVYQHFDDPREAKQLFVRISRMDELSHRTSTALRAWIEADYPGTWDAWWEHDSHQDAR